MLYNFDRLISRRNTGCYKWDANKTVFGRDDLLSFWVADMDFPCAQPIVEAIQERMKHPFLGYTFQTDAYYEAIINWLKKRHGWEVEREWLAFCATGVIQAIHLMVDRFTGQGDEIILHLPAYRPLIHLITRNKRKLIKNFLIQKNNHYIIDFEDLLSKVSLKTKLLLLCSPHNPTGRVWTRDELIQLGDICLSNHITVISDEIHADLVFKNVMHFPFGSLSHDFAMNSITCISASKTFNISGLQLATLIIPNPELRTIVNEALDTAQVTHGNVFGEVALEAGYRYCEDWLEQVMDYIESNLAYLSTFINEQMPEVDMVRPQGTYLVWLDFRKCKIPAEEMKRAFIDEAHIALYDGSQFGEEREGFFRMNIACPKSVLEEGLKRMANVMKKFS